MKRCSKCGLEKLFSEFGKHPRGLYGLKSWCKKCLNESSKKYGLAHHDKMRELHREWRLANPEHVRKYAREQARKRYHANPEKERERQRIKREKNPQKQIDSVVRWQKAHPEKTYIYRANRRHRRRNGGKITLQEWQDLCNKYGNKCLCCGKADVKLTMDHVLPLKLGGKNTIDNIQPLCHSCNSRKHLKYIDYRKR